MNPLPGRVSARVAALGALALLSCDLGPAKPEYDPESPWTDGVLETWQAGLHVEDAGGCSTAVVHGLAQQLVDEIDCLRPGTLVDFSRGDINEADSVWHYLQGPAVPDLHRAIDQRGRAMSVNSALRTLPQQYLLYKWWQAGQCGITLAARPGHSPHESGKAIDIEDHAGWQNALENHNFNWHGADDAVHFDYVGAGTVDLAGLSVQAFQRLWNRNHPDDTIAEDGIYGPQTEGKLRVSPVDGFPIGGCEPVPPPPDPDAAPPPPPPPDPDAAPPPPPDAAPLVPDVQLAPADAAPHKIPDDAAEAADAFTDPDGAVDDARTAWDAAPTDGATERPDALRPVPPAQQDVTLRHTGAHFSGGCQSAPSPPPAAGGLLLWGLALITSRRRNRL